MNLLALAVMLFGLGLAGFALAKIHELRAIRRWPATRGRIISSRVIEEESASAGEHDTSSIIYRPEVHFEYAVGGREYASSRVQWVPRAASWRGLAEGVVARYAAGREATVYYDPTDPRRAVLEREGTGLLVGVSVLGIAMAAGAALWAAA